MFFIYWEFWKIFKSKFISLFLLFFLLYSLLASSFAISISSLWYLKLTNLKLFCPDCLVPKISPGPLKIRSSSAIRNPSSLCFNVFNLCSAMWERLFSYSNIQLDFLFHLPTLQFQNQYFLKVYTQTANRYKSELILLFS